MIGNGHKLEHQRNCDAGAGGTWPVELHALEFRADGGDVLDHARLEQKPVQARLKLWPSAYAIFFRGGINDYFQSNRIRGGRRCWFAEGRKVPIEIHGFEKVPE